MLHRCDAPRYGGASRKRCGACFRDLNIHPAAQTQLSLGLQDAQPNVGGTADANTIDGGQP